jgi:hypothetical protein
MASNDDTPPVEDFAATAFGTVRSDEPAAAFAARLARSGLEASARHSSHMTGSDYVLVRQGTARATFERVGESEWLLRADAPELVALEASMRAISDALANEAIAHRIECYAADETLVHVMVWPREE